MPLRFITDSPITAASVKAASSLESGIPEPDEGSPVLGRAGGVSSGGTSSVAGIVGAACGVASVGTGAVGEGDGGFGAGQAARL